jgi:hypothetical protein
MRYDGSMDLYQKILDDSFDSVYSALKRRSALDTFSLETVKNELDSLYVYEGHGWVGRGEFKQAEIEGSILAYQVFLLEYGKES